MLNGKVRCMPEAGAKDMFGGEGVNANESRLLDMYRDKNFGVGNTYLKYIINIHGIKKVGI